MMHRYLFASIAGIVLIGAGGQQSSTVLHAAAGAAVSQQPPVVFEPDGSVRLPTGFRKWVFVGAPLTPNGLNHGEAGFPEYHHVYVEQKNVDAFLRTGTFPEGTVIVKELTRLLAPAFPDGSREEASV